MATVVTWAVLKLTVEGGMAKQQYIVDPEVFEACESRHQKRCKELSLRNRAWSARMKQQARPCTTYSVKMT